MALDPRFAKAYEKLRQSRIRYMSVTETRDVENLPQLQEARRDLDIARAQVRARRKEFHPTEQDLRFRGVIGRCVIGEKQFRIEHRLLDTSGDRVSLECPVCDTTMTMSIPGTDGEHTLRFDDLSASIARGSLPPSIGVVSADSAGYAQVIANPDHLTAINRRQVANLLKQFPDEPGLVVLRQLSPKRGSLKVRLDPDGAGPSSHTVDGSGFLMTSLSRWIALPRSTQVVVSIDVRDDSIELEERFRVRVAGEEVLLLTVRATVGSQPAEILLHRVR